MDVQYSRGVALEVVVDVDSDTGISGLVCTGDGDLWWVSRAAPANVDLGTADVL